MRRWDLRDDCLIISGQMRHFAPDFIAFLIHYSCLTSHGGNAISGQTATGRANEQTLQSYLAITGGAVSSDGCVRVLRRHIAALRFLRLHRFSGRFGPIPAPGRLFSQHRSDEHVCVIIHNIMNNSASPGQRSLRRPITGTLLCQICWYPHRRDGC